ncbi:MAG: DUF4411 family protein [Candidatus Marinimicrobia bacterium]|nr:DUF4411 family protein [Candidatus Neomarinimicrobiota bacterium]
MLYLLDANVLIDANRDYYAIDRVREFWEWLIYQGQQDQLKIPIEIYEEIVVGNDSLAKWLKENGARSSLQFNQNVEQTLVAMVIDMGYANDLSDDEIENIGRDPFLIAYAFADPANRCIVTTEGSKPSMTRANRHIPDICDDLNINWCDSFEFLRRLDFKTDWITHIN